MNYLPALTVLVTTFYSIESVYAKLVMGGFLNWTYDPIYGKNELLPATFGNAENIVVRKQAALAGFLKMREEYINSLADRWLVYVWGASFGEARHAETHGICYPAEIRQGGDRSVSSQESLAFDPRIPQNVEALSILFDNSDWGSSFGGKAWAKIVDTIELYHVNKTVFIDIVNDIEHNSGSVFNKGESAEIAGFYIDSRLHAILESKKHSDITQSIHFRYGCFPDVYNVLDSVCREVLGIRLPKGGTEAELTTWKKFALPKFGKNKLSLAGWEYPVEKGDCEYCSRRLPIEEMRYISGHGYVCENCQEENFSECDDCGDTESNDDLISTGDSIVCSHCYRNYSSCEHCGEVYKNDELVWVDGEDDKEILLCKDCEEALLAPCAHCGVVTFTSTMYTPTHYLGSVCEDCGKVLEAAGYNEDQQLLEGVIE